jgi:hypothetical protein
MGERSDLPRLYISVDPSKLSRCRWCGTSESEEWVHGEIGTYCSDRCKKAARVKSPLAIICFSMVGLLATVGIFALGGPADGMVALLVMIFAGCIVCYECQESNDAVSQVPEGSRKSKALDEISMLKTIMTHLECPNCDGNIEVDTIEEDQVYHCGYCGASGIVEITFTKGKR